MERFIERFRYKATKARQAQSRVKKLDKMERLERDPPRRPQPAVRVLDAATLRARDLRAARRPRRGRGGDGEPAVTLLEHAELWLERGEHVSLVGPNGAGKTTLIEILAGRRELPAGKLSIGHNVKVGYLSQHAEELGAGGPPEQSVLEAAQRATGLTPGKARALLGRFLFSGEEAEKPLAGLSGGERRRLSLAVLVGAAQPPNVLILDEPTNHLDIESREALEDALRAFPGAILLVSHDRALLDAVGTRTSPSRTAPCTPTSAAGPSTRARARSAPARRRRRRARRRRTRARRGPPAGAGAGGAAPQRLRRPARAGTPPPRAGRAKAASAPSRQSEGALEEPRQRDSRRRRSRRRSGGSVTAASSEAELAQPEAWATRYESAKSEARHTAARRAVEAAYERACRRSAKTG